MGNIGQKRGRLWPVAILMACPCSFLGAQDATTGGDTVEPFRVQMPRNQVARAVTVALEGADRLLSQPACLDVLDDFRDAKARTLREVLHEKSVSARSYLRWIVFADGRGSMTCGAKGALAITVPGSRVVFVCPAAFLATSAEETEVAVIHEMLHSLGLGENPPTAKEISKRIKNRCRSLRPTITADGTRP
jgi:hypothetical protein